MRIKKFNENISSKDLIEILKDSLSELIDNKKVFFNLGKNDNNKPTVYIIVELENYFHLPFSEDIGFDTSDSKKFQITLDEINNIIMLVNEGLVRSQIDKSLRFTFCDGNSEYIEFIRNFGRYGSRDYFIVFYVY